METNAWVPPSSQSSQRPDAKGGLDAIGRLWRIFALGSGSYTTGFLMRMVYSPCGLAYSLFKVSCPLGRYLKAACNPRMDVDSLSAYDCAHPSAE